MKLLTMPRTRREFLHNCGVVTAAAAIPHFLVNTAQKVAAAEGWEAGSGHALPGFKDDRILVVIQLSGGNDGLNTVIPHGDDTYFKSRPRLGLDGGKRIRVDDHVSFNSALAPLKGLYDAGNVAVIEGVGYPNPNRSHFRSMEIWHTASDSDKNEHDGWVGKYFDNCCEGKPQPTAGIFVGNELPQAFWGQKGMGISFAAPEDFGYVAGKKGDDTRAFRAVNRKDAQANNDSLDFLRHMTDGAMSSCDKIHEVAAKVKNKTQYPREKFADSLSVIARMIGGGLGTRIYYTALGGFDTHANQEGTQNRLHGVWSNAVASFMRDLHEMGQSQRVTVMVFSEFGRRVTENASGGTDHGTAAPMFVIGEKVKGGLHGKRPSLTDLDQGDLKFTTDFRSVYASVLDRWFSIKPSIVLERDFPRLPIIA